MKHAIPKSQLALFFSLYTTQYVGVGFMMVALVGILRQGGAELADLSIAYVIGIPWILKFAWAPLIDRFGYNKWGHYRGWLLLLQLLMVIFLLILSQLSLDEQFSQVVAMGTIFVILSATQDVAVDALASREFDDQQRGFINGIQLSGGMLGNIIGGGLVLILYESIGWQGAFFMMAAVTSISWFQLLFFRESSSIPDEKVPTVVQTFKRLFSFWRGKGLWFLLVFSSAISFSMVYAILTPLMLDAGKTLADVGMALNVFGTGIGVLAGLSGGWLIQKLGRVRALKSFFLLQIISFVAILPVAYATNDLTIYFTMMIYFIIYPIVAAIMSTLMMDYAAHDAASGTTYTVQYTVSFFSGMLMSGLGMQVAQYFGYSGVIITAIGVAILTLILAVIYVKKLPKHIHIDH